MGVSRDWLANLIVEKSPMSFKMLSAAAVPSALEKAERYRLLNEPGEAESICLDVLKVDPDNQQALVVLLLALTDQYDHAYEVSEIQPQDVLGRLKSPYQHAYYAGIIAERRAKAKLHGHGIGSAAIAYDLLLEAMGRYEEAEKLRPAGNDDAILRWNTCARIIARNKLVPALQTREDPPLE